MSDQFNQLRELILERDASLRKHLDEQFAGVDKQLTYTRDHVDERFAQLDERFAQLDERFAQMHVYVDERFAQMHVYVDERFAQMRDYVDERSRDIETRLLTEFHKWASRIESTIRPLPLRLGGHEERIALIEERLRGLDNPIF